MESKETRDQQRAQLPLEKGATFSSTNLMCVAFLKCVNNTSVAFITQEWERKEVGVLPERPAGRLPETSQGDSDFGEFTRAHLPLHRLQNLTLTDA